jgi:hypothetical protein
MGNRQHKAGYKKTFRIPFRIARNSLFPDPNYLPSISSYQ